jgi:hypothetical protein
MTGHRPFTELTKNWPAPRRARVESRKAELQRTIEELALADLRKALKVSQEELASALGKSQAAIAQMEQRADMKISTLRQTIEAMGGKLELVAHFPTGDVSIVELGEQAD